MEQYEEVETEYYDEEFTTSDVLFITGVVFGSCLIAAFIAYLIRKTFKNLHVKVGNKIEIGMETKED